MDRGDRDDHADGGAPPGVGGGFGGGGFDSTVLKLKGLPFQAGERDIFDFFHGFSVVSAHVIMEPDGGRPSGMGFAEFSAPEEARRAMARDRAYIGDRFVKLIRVPRHEMEQQMSGGGGQSFAQQGSWGHGGSGGYGIFSRQQGHGYGGGGGYQDRQGGGSYGGQRSRGGGGYREHQDWGRGGYGQQDGGGHGYSQGGRGGGGGQAPMGVTQGLSVKIRGLPFRVSEQEVLDFFTGYAAVPSSFQMGSDHTGRPSGEGWITFSSTAEAQRAVDERNREYLGNRYLELTVV